MSGQPTFRHAVPVSLGTGKLPTTPPNDSPYATWQFLSETLVSIDNDPQVISAINGLYNAYLSGGNVVPYQTELNNLFAGFAASITGLVQSPYSSITIFLQNTQGVIRACNNTGLIGEEQNGRTEVVVAQTNNGVIPCTWRLSSTSNKSTFYVAKASTFNYDSACAIYILRISAVLKQ